jgi:hypothetical protein
MWSKAGTLKLKGNEAVNLNFCNAERKESFKVENLPQRYKLNYTELNKMLVTCFN